MIGVQFNGRLGNQIFQYYFMAYLKSRKKYRFYFFDNTDQAYFYKYFEIGWFSEFIISSRVIRKLITYMKMVLSFKTVYVLNTSSPRNRSPHNFELYHGYFQSDYYLLNTPAYKPLEIKKKYVQDFENKVGSIFRDKKTIVVHIRLTDYVSYGKRDVSLPLEYYMTQLKTIKNKEDYSVIFVSDEIKKVKDFFGDKPNYIFSENSEIIDFQIIKNADIAIIANSTFAWWACYFATKEQHVIAPANWFGFRIGREHPKGIMTKRFVWARVLPN